MVLCPSRTRRRHGRTWSAEVPGTACLGCICRSAFQTGQGAQWISIECFSLKGAPCLSRNTQETLPIPRTPSFSSFRHSMAMKLVPSQKIKAKLRFPWAIRLLQLGLPGTCRWRAAHPPLPRHRLKTVEMPLRKTHNLDLSFKIIRWTLAHSDRSFKVQRKKLGRASFLPRARKGNPQGKDGEAQQKGSLPDTSKNPPALDGKNSQSACFWAVYRNMYILRTQETDKSPRLSPGPASASFCMRSRRTAVGLASPEVRHPHDWFGPKPATEMVFPSDECSTQEARSFLQAPVRKAQSRRAKGKRRDP